jgi:hypothetical protein
VFISLRALFDDKPFRVNDVSSGSKRPLATSLRNGPLKSNCATDSKRTCWHRLPRQEGVTGSIPVAPTIQSPRTADFQAGSKRAVSVGIFAGTVPLFRSPATLAPSQADFWPPVSASKNSVPRGRVFDGQIPFGCREFWGVGRPKATFRTRSVVIADSIQGLRTAGSILAEHREVARLRCRVANDLRPRRARGLVRGTRAISSC